MLVGPHKQFEYCQHTKVHLLGIKAQYITKRVLFPDWMSFQSLSFLICWTIAIIVVHRAGSTLALFIVTEVYSYLLQLQLKEDNIALTYNWKFYKENIWEKN